MLIMLSNANRPRLTVARLMVVIAIVGLVLAGARWIDAMRTKVAQRQSTSLKHESEIRRWKVMTGWVDKRATELKVFPYPSRFTAS